MLLVLACVALCRHADLKTKIAKKYESCERMLPQPVQMSPLHIFTLIVALMMMMMIIMTMITATMMMMMMMMMNF